MFILDVGHSSESSIYQNHMPIMLKGKGLQSSQGP